MLNSHAEKGNLQEVVLSGGPPWGFTLSGGSEFGSRLYVKKVSKENKAIRGTLLVGDEILSVNGVKCNSRRNAIQMVGKIDEELRLQIYRWNTKSDIQSSNSSTSPKVYDNMVETMGDLQQSFYSLKRNSIQTKNFNNNDNVLMATTTVKYNINPTSYSSIERSVDGYEDRQQQHDLQKVSTSQPHRQKVTVKMVPVAKRTNATAYPNNSSKMVSSSVTTLPETDLDETDAIDQQSVQKVSTARAMFESMSSVKNSEQPKTTRPKLKAWNSGGSLIDEHGSDRRGSTQQKEEDSNRLEHHVPPVHKHSRSLPIEIAGQEFAAAYAAYRQQSTNQPSTNVTTTTKNAQRPKSAIYTESVSDKTTSGPTVPQRFSQSDILRNYRSKSSQGHIDLVNEATSKSTENLLSMQEKRASLGGSTSPSGSNKDSANELRQAASRYHQELMKNYPKFRHSISGKDIGPQKFPRKMSEDNFSRGEPLRATIATTTARVPRSKSMDTASWNFEGENSMMSRLLQGQSPATLMKIEEEAKNRNKENINNSFLIRTNSLDCSSQLRRTSLEPVMKSICIQTDPGTEDNVDVQTSDGTVDVQTNTEKEQHSTTRTVYDSKTMFDEPADIHRNSSFINDFEPAQLPDVDATIDDLVLPTHSDISPQKDRSMVVHATNLENRSYIHCKESSTDSAVYINKDHSMIEHASTDSINELNSINMAALNLDHEQSHTEDSILPPPPDDLLPGNEGTIVEKEKPQRTINRKKKDSGPVSRNSSCVSTDSTTSTATVDSGIVLRLDSSPRTSPISTSQYYSNKDLTASRENLDDDVRALEEENRHKSPSSDHHHEYDNSYHGDMSQHNDSMSGDSTNIENLDHEKTKLIESMREKINELREQEQEISEEIKINEELGKKVLGMVETKATQSEFSKYELFIGELNKIVALLLSLTQRLHRYEMMLQDLDMSNESDKLKKDGLISKIDKLKSQHEEACYLRDVNDKRGDNVAIFLEKYCTEEEFADFQYYVDMKSQLALMQSEIREKVKLGCSFC